MYEYAWGWAKDGRGAASRVMMSWLWSSRKKMSMACDMLRVGVLRVGIVYSVLDIERPDSVVLLQLYHPAFCWLNLLR